MFSKLIRDFKLYQNHKKRVNSIVLKSNEEIVRTMDSSKDRYLEAERLSQKEDYIRYKAIHEVLEWLIETK